jgi:RND superfamily putative drug exporter
MDRLERFVARRRRLVLVAWAVLILVAVAFASRQTENLTGGGFEPKGSGSQIVADALAREFPGMQPNDLAVVFDNRRGDRAALQAAVDRVQREAAGAVRLDSRAVAAARASDRQIVVPR